MPLPRHRLPISLLAALLASAASATIDRDGDGISDLWSDRYPLAGTAAEDLDGDGATTLAEAVAGTDPRDTADRFVAEPRRDGAGNLRLHWTGVAGKRYQLRASSDLATWTELPETYLGTGAELHPILIAAGASTAGPQFWQAIVSDTDTDADGLDDWEETQLGTSPTVADTDGDELTDGWEVLHATDPLVPTAPVVTAAPASVAIVEGQTATFTVAASGDGPFGYQWLRDGTPVDEAQFLRHTTAPATLADNGATFAVRITDASGRSTLSPSARLTVAAATRRTQHHVDPVSGTDDGDGSPARPWRSLQAVVDTRVETRNWDALPYNEDRTQVAVRPGAAVQAGDTIWLHDGDHGALVIRSAYNVAPISLVAAPGAHPRFSKVQVQSAANWILRGLSVSPSYAATYSVGTIASVESHGWRGPAADIELDGLEVFSVPDESVWATAADWDTLACNGINVTGSRVRVRRCQVRHVDFAISTSGAEAMVDRNTIDGFAGDGLRGLGDESAFEYNLVKNRRNVNTNHPDGFQSWSSGPGGVGTGVVRRIVLRGNVFIAYESPALPFAGSIQGIGCFDGFYEDWIVENNLVVTDHWHGITLLGARRCRIVNNTVVDLLPGNSPTPWIMVAAHKNATASTDCVVRNNLTTRLNTAADTANRLVVDHNLVLPADLAGTFAAPPAFDYHLVPGSPAIDQGAAALAPTLDADGTPRPRGAAVDLGAYEFEP